jgi:hypothetical protein
MTIQNNRPVHGPSPKQALQQVTQMAELVTSRALDAVHVGADAPGRLQRANSAAQALTNLLATGILDGPLDKKATAALEKMSENLAALTRRMDAFHENPMDKAAAQEAGQNVSVASGSLSYQAELGRDAAARDAVMKKGGPTADLLQRMESFGLSLRVSPSGSFGVSGLFAVQTVQKGGEAQSPASGKTPAEALKNAWSMITTPGVAVHLSGGSGPRTWDPKAQNFVPAELDAAKQSWVPKARS